MPVTLINRVTLCTGVIKLHERQAVYFCLFYWQAIDFVFFVSFVSNIV